MKPTIFATIFCLASLSVAQDISQFPQCSIQCLLAAVQSTGCDLTDYKCQCTTNRDKVQQAVVPCLTKNCSPDELIKVQEVSNSFCSSALAGGTATSSAASKATAAPATTSSKSSGSTTASSAATAQKSNAAGARHIEIVEAAAGVLAAGILAL